MVFVAFEDQPELTDSKLYLSRSLNRFQHIFAAAGHPNCVFEISYNQLLEITHGSEKEISE